MRKARVAAWLQLLRPANIVTAWADILAGFAVATAVAAVSVGGFAASAWDLVLLVIATTGLYGGGVVLNDYFDADLDAVERPERPIPSRRVTPPQAAGLGIMLLVIGVGAAQAVSGYAGTIALLVALGAVVYDRWGKHHPILGPVNMGACRAGNLLLGMAAIPAVIGHFWYLGALPLAYIGAITAVSRGEVHGGSRSAGVTGLVLILLVLAGLLALSVLDLYRLLHALPFLLLFAGAVVPSFVRSAARGDAGSIRRAVRTGVLFLIVLDASVAAGFGGWPFGLATVMLLPVSLGLARLFAVT